MPICNRILVDANGIRRLVTREKLPRKAAAHLMAAYPTRS